jgi:hypothetical protein
MQTKVDDALDDEIELLVVERKFCCCVFAVARCVQ